MTDNDNCAIMGSYTTFKHIKTRKVVVLEVEVAEEYFEEVISKLGMPIGGESKPVAVALLSNGIYNKPSVVGSSNIQQTEGEKLRIRAVLLCRERDFQIFCESLNRDIIVFNENAAREFILIYCKINSRSDLAKNIEAQVLFKQLLEKYKDWQAENNYADNLNRF